MAAKKKKLKDIEEVVALEGGDLLDEIISTGIKPKGDDQTQHGKDLIENFVAQLIDPTTKVDKNVVKTINARVAAIDELVSKQLDEVLHHEDFQRLEGSWRGLHKLVMGTETGEMLKLRVMNCNKQDLLKDFESATEFTESALFKKIYTEEYGQLGGDAYGALVGDFEFGKGAQDIALLDHISGVAAAAHAPFLTAAGAQMFGLESFTEMPKPRDLAKVFDKNNPENTKWLSFRDAEDSRYVSMVVPHVLRRLPYGDDNPVEEFNYQETIDGEHDNYLWGNAAYELGGRLTDAFAKYHWCVAIRGIQGGGLVEDLPIHTFKTREGDVGSKCPTEVLIPDSREAELSNLGFIPLLNAKNTDYAVFIGGNSVQKPQKYSTAEATANADLSTKLPYLMATSRIAHYMMALTRDKLGSFTSRSAFENYMNDWIKNYTLGTDEASQAAMAERPLRDARVDVVEDKSRPGCYKAVAFLRPHFQLEKVDFSLRLVADLPPAAG